ncbi:MAG TPA: hypothetical protein VFT38_06935 [Vicinamibacteria bacterium]|nr:hypothetical protein [Vicinamibacteria bacterium]
MSPFFWLTLAGAVASCLLVLLLIGRRNERLIRRDWELLLTPRGEKVYGAIEGKVRAEIGMADLSFEHAMVYRELGTTEEAIRLLDVGYRVIEKFAPDMLRLLGMMATFSRMVSAIAPVRPLRPKDFRLVQVSSLAYLHGMLHQFLVSASERYRLKMYILGRSFGLATRFLLKSIQNLGVGATDATREWEQIEAIRSDFQTLTDESLDSLRVLLTAMAREDRQDLLRQIEPR